MFFELIEKRRSIRKFKSRNIEKEKIEKLAEAALRSPSSRGINPWIFIIVDDIQILKKLSAAKPHGSSFLKDAPLCFVVCADSEKTDTWVEDTSIASIFLQLAAEALGLSSCWIQIRKRGHDDSMSAETYIQKILKIPAKIKILSIIAMGYPDEEKAPHPLDSLHMEKIFHNAFEM